MASVFCPFCGKELVEEALFCMYCGKKVPTRRQNEKTAFPVEEQAQSMDSTNKKPIVPPISNELEPTVPQKAISCSKHIVKLGNHEVVFDEATMAYNEIRTLFANYGTEAKATFEEAYDKNVSCFDDLYEKALPEAMEATVHAIHFAVETLSKLGVKIDEKEFLGYAKNGIKSARYFQKYIDIENELVQVAEDLHNYRQSNRNKAPSVQWQGGGFGLKGALKGAAMAGLLNLGTDAVKGIAHSMVDSADRVRIKKIEDKIFTSSDHRAIIGNQIYDFCVGLFMPAERLLEEAGKLCQPKLDILTAVGPISQATDIINNAEEVSDEEYEQALKLTLEGMIYEPYLITSYLNLYKIPMVSNHDVFELVNLFCIENEFAENVVPEEERIESEFQALPENSSDQVSTKIAKAEELQNHLCYISLADDLTRLKGKKIALARAEEELSAQRALEKQRIIEAKAKEEQRAIEFEAEFLRIQQLPEETVEQLEAKFMALDGLFVTPEVEDALERIERKLQESKVNQQKLQTETDFLSAFPKGLSAQKYAKKLVHNIVFQETYQKLSGSLEAVKSVVKNMYEMQISYYNIITDTDMDRLSGKIETKRRAFAPFKDTEIPIMYVCEVNDAWGMLLTNQKIYLQGVEAGDIPYSFPLNEITSIELEKEVNRFNYQLSYMIVNNTPRFRVYTTLLKSMGDDLFVQLIQFFIDYCLFLAAKNGVTSDSFYMDVLQAAGMSDDEFKASTIKRPSSDIDLIIQKEKHAQLLIASRDFESLWKQVEKEDVCSCYALQTYYKKLIEEIDPDDDRNHYPKVAAVISKEISSYEPMPFAYFLEAYLWYNYHKRNRQDYKVYSEKICTLADQRVPSAMALKGFWETQNQCGFSGVVKDGISLLTAAAAMDEPTALAWLGSYYRSGFGGLSVDLSLAEKYLVRGAAYGQPYAKLELEKLRTEGRGYSKDTSSGCFITSAVCRNHSKDDNCYELTMFRAFRDGWLAGEVDGQSLIERYYYIAPKIVEMIDRQTDSANIYNDIYTKYLRPCLLLLESEKYNECKTLYVKMVQDLADQYKIAT